MTAADPPDPWSWFDQLLKRPSSPGWENHEPLVPVCACGVHMYTPDSQAAGMCFLCCEASDHCQRCSKTLWPEGSCSNYRCRVKDGTP
jgi:hypothetical protein